MSFSSAHINVLEAYLISLTPNYTVWMRIQTQVPAAWDQRTVADISFAKHNFTKNIWGCHNILFVIYGEGSWLFSYENVEGVGGRVYFFIASDIHLFCYTNL